MSASVGSKRGAVPIAVRSNAALDRLNVGACEALHRLHRVLAGCGLWFLIGFASDDARREWADPVKAALRLFCDSGFGGERSRGWGRAEMPEFIEGDLTCFVVPPVPQIVGQAPRLRRTPRPPPKLLPPTPSQHRQTCLYHPRLIHLRPRHPTPAFPSPSPDSPSPNQVCRNPSPLRLCRNNPCPNRRCPSLPVPASNHGGSFRSSSRMPASRSTGPKASTKSSRARGALKAPCTTAI